ncbi:MAG: hypothetical protein AUI02_09820 [Acidobacteria bacterium 13_2_20CM_2_57_12]|nr:MAG: hypothetical protein AUI02_09820 [Acidobacteria bacterium 13_2_20CM_2_57_12]
MERGKSKGFANSIGELIVVDRAADTPVGSTNAIEVSNERSESWQQDIVQAMMPDISCPQSM